MIFKLINNLVKSSLVSGILKIIYSVLILVAFQVGKYQGTSQSGSGRRKIRPQETWYMSSTGTTGIAKKNKTGQDVLTYSYDSGPWE